MIDNKTLTEQGRIYMRLAHNILNDSDEITKCITDASIACASAKHKDLNVLEARYVRHLALSKVSNIHTISLLWI